MSERNCYITLAVGQRASGKTTSTIALAEASGKKIIVVDIDFHPRYQDWDKVDHVELKKWDGNRCLVLVDEEQIEEALKVLMKYHSNAFVILEDCQRFVSQMVQPTIKKFIIDHRKHGFDVALMYHALKFVPPFIAMNYNILILHKTQEDASNNLNGKYGNWELIRRKMQLVKQNKDPHYCELIYDNQS